jgi:hypothetical protein
MRTRTVKISEGYLRMIADSLEIVLQTPPQGMSATEAVATLASSLRTSVAAACAEQHKRPHGW